LIHSKAELNLPIPKVPEVFMKPSSCLLDPCDPIILPRSAGNAIDAEVELAIIIGRDCKDVSVEAALEYVLGYTVANDITARDVQSQILQWSYCKGYDGFCPLGPALVSAKALPDLSKVMLKTTLNGNTLQNSSVSDMIFTIPEIIQYLSRVSNDESDSTLCALRVAANQTCPGYDAAERDGDLDRNAIGHWPQPETAPVYERRF
jgi:2-keto-4-pentenoate hydratase/2-oxohepta-3-ene-1,7-dioic acid hydratase in catechol pathway